MAALWFCVVLGMLAMYAVLDGFDLGAGVIHLFLARSENERRSVLASAGSFWDGNEIWLLLAGGALYCAFPAVYASRGFYLAAIALLWLLILRGIGTELRDRVEGPTWRRASDAAFAVASILLALFLGTAVGYMIRGVPDWFPILCGVCGLACLTLQSAAWMAFKSAGALQRRCRRFASGVWWAVLFCYVSVTAASFGAQPQILGNLLAHTWICGFAVMALAGLIGTRLCLNVGFDLGAFAGGSCLIVGLLASGAAGQFPYLLNHQLTVYNAGSSHYGMSVSAIWWIPAFVVAAGYNVGMHRLFRHRIAGAHPHPVMTAD